MNILVVSQFFPPEVAAGGIRVHELGRHWVQAGHNVTVITGFPNYPSGIISPEYRSKRRHLRWIENKDGMKVIRTWTSVRPNGGSLDRLCNYTSFSVSAALEGFVTERPDIIIGTSPPLTVGLAAFALAKAKNTRWVLEVRDLWPESLAALDENGKSISFRTLARMARFLYKRCDHIVPVSPAFIDRLHKDWQVATEKMSVVENGVEQTAFRPGAPDDGVRQELELQGKFVVSYVGTIGLAHGLATILRVAELLKNSMPELRFVLIGGGAEADRLMTECRERGLHNVQFTGVQKRERIPDLIRASDVCLVLLRKADIFKTVIPTKMLEAMACARPVILGVDGQARHIIESAQAGIYVEAENAPAIANAIINLKASPELCRNLGAHGKRHIDRHFSRHTMASRYTELLERLAFGVPAEAENNPSATGVAA